MKKIRKGRNRDYTVSLVNGMDKVMDSALEKMTIDELYDAIKHISGLVGGAFQYVKDFRTGVLSAYNFLKETNSVDLAKKLYKFIGALLHLSMLYEMKVDMDYESIKSEYRNVLILLTADIIEESLKKDNKKDASDKKREQMQTELIDKMISKHETDSERLEAVVDSNFSVIPYMRQFVRLSSKMDMEKKGIFKRIKEDEKQKPLFHRLYWPIYDSRNITMLKDAQRNPDQFTIDDLKVMSDYMTGTDESSSKVNRALFSYNNIRDRIESLKHPVNNWKSNQLSLNELITLAREIRMLDKEGRYGDIYPLCFKEVWASKEYLKNVYKSSNTLYPEALKELKKIRTYVKSNSFYNVYKCNNALDRLKIITHLKDMKVSQSMSADNLWIDYKYFINELRRFETDAVSALFMYMREEVSKPNVYILPEYVYPLYIIADQIRKLMKEDGGKVHYISDIIELCSQFAYYMEENSDRLEDIMSYFNNTKIDILKFKKYNDYVFWDIANKAKVTGKYK